MTPSPIRISSNRLLVCALALCCVAHSVANAQKPASAAKGAVPKQAAPAVQVKALVEQSLAKNPYYAPGNLISRRDVEVLFNQLLEKGITSPDDQEDLVESVLSDSTFLVGRLKTPAGRAFMKKIASDPTVYDRLERLSWTSDGRQIIDNFLNAPDGPAKLQQLKTAGQVAKMSKRLAADPRTADFAQPTSRVHTAAELVDKLQEVLAAKNAAQ
jgi:hypothetical protein